MSKSMPEQEENFIRNCFASSNSPKTKELQKVVLVSTGSFNPAHKMHIQVFSHAYDYLIDNNYNLVCGFVAPSSDGYV